MADILTPELLQALDSETTFTYSSLCNYIQRFLDRTDDQTVNAIPQFLTLGQSRLAADLKILGGLQEVEFTVPAGATPQTLPYSTIIEKPAGWRQNVSLAVITPKGRNYAYVREYEYLQNYLQDFSQLNLTSQNNYNGYFFYADADYSNIIIGPLVTNIAYDFEWRYFSEIQLLSSSVQTNWFTIYSPRALLYAALIEADSYVRSDDRTSIWEQKYMAIIDQLKKEDLSRFVDNSNTRSN